MWTMTDEQAFAWLRSLAPSAGKITVYDDAIRQERVVILEGASSQEVKRVRMALHPWVRWRVAPDEGDQSQ